MSAMGSMAQRQLSHRVKGSRVSLRGAVGGLEEQSQVGGANPCPGALVTSAPTQAGPH